MPATVKLPLVIRPARKLWYHAGARYFSMPYEVTLDWRLSHAERSVLAALASFVFQNDTVYPARGAIAERAGVDPSNVSRLTRRLEGFGWLVKQQRAYNSVMYTLVVPPVIPPRPATVDAPTSTATASPAAPAASTAAQQSEQGLAGPVRRLRPEDQIPMQYPEEPSADAPHGNVEWSVEMDHADGPSDDEAYVDDDWGDQYID